MSKLRRAGTWSMLAAAFAVAMAATFVVVSTVGRIFLFGSIELSIPQIGIICGGVTSIPVFVRCVKQLKSKT